MNFEKKDSQTIKGIAILLLLFYHLFAQTYVYAGFEVNFLLNQEHIVWFASFGNICVAIFLFISAYGITTSLQTLDRTKDYKAKIVKKSFKRVVVLILHFFVMYCSIWIIWFSKLNYVSAYGEGKQSVLFAITDAFGFAEIFKTPTICMTWWYMQLAIFSIILVPLFQEMYKKIGNLLLIILLLIPGLFSFNMDVYTYIFVIAIGVCASNGNWINQCKKVNIPRLLKIFISIFLMVITFLLRSNAVVDIYYSFVFEGIIAFMWVISIYIIFENIPLITKTLQFIGKHSMNIFFFHTFIYLILYRDQIYSLKYAGIIFTTVLGISLIYSIIIEFIKNKMGFYKLIKKIKGENNG